MERYEKNQLWSDWSTFTQWLLAFVAILVLAVGISTVTVHHYDYAAYSTVQNWNLTWEMAAGKKAIKKDELGQLAVDIRDYLHKDIPSDMNGRLARILSCKENSYPGLGKKFGNSLFASEDGGYMQSGFRKEFETFQKEGLNAMLRSPLRAPVPVSDLQEIRTNNALIAEYNQLWEMIAGKRALDYSPTGHLAADLRDHFNLSGIKRPSVFSELEFWSGDNAVSLNSLLGREAFGTRNLGTHSASGADNLVPTGEVSKDLVAAINTLAAKGLPSVIEKVQYIPPAYELCIFGWRFQPNSLLPWVLVWLLLPCLPFLFADFSASHLSFWQRDRETKLMVARLALAAPLAMLIVWLLHCRSSWHSARQGIRDYSAQLENQNARKVQEKKEAREKLEQEKNHPFAQERKIAQEVLDATQSLTPDPDVLEIQRQAQSILDREPAEGNITDFINSFSAVDEKKPLKDNLKQRLLVAEKSIDEQVETAHLMRENRNV